MRGWQPKEKYWEVGVDVMVKKYRVALAEEEQQELKGLVSRGRAAAYRQTLARILLFCDENQANGPMKDEEIARVSRVNYICRFLLPHSEMLPKL